MSKQSLLDKLSKASEAVHLDPTPGHPLRIEEYHYFAIVIRELSNFMSQYDTALAGILTDIFDNPPVNDEAKRSGHGATIVRPSLSFIAGTATKNLGKTISGDLWGQGFMSRVIMIYSSEQPEIEWFTPSDRVANQVDPELTEALAVIGSLKGRVLWSQAAMRAANEWRKSKFQPEPIHPKLIEYNARRFLHVSKLTLISALSDARMEIELDDFLRGRRWLEIAESAMPEIFKEMTTHSDGEVLRELHMHLWALYASSKRPLPRAILVSYLSDKVASHYIRGLIENAEGMGLVERMAGTDGMTAMYVPKQYFGDFGT